MQTCRKCGKDQRYPGSTFCADCLVAGGATLGPPQMIDMDDEMADGAPVAPRKRKSEMDRTPYHKGDETGW